MGRERTRTVAVSAVGLRHVLGGRAVLDGVDVSVDQGESLAVTGPSGSGKTTLLMCLAGLLVPDEGAVSVADVALSGLSPGRRAAARLRHIGVVYQFGELLPELSPLENVALPALLAGTGRREAWARARRLLEDLGVESLGEATTGHLSGGERQRVAVARALVTSPAVLLADEPTGSLDRDSAEVVAKLLFALPREHGCALVVVTHNERIAAGADRWTELDGGCLREVSR